MTKPQAPTDLNGVRVMFPVKDAGAGSLLSAFFRSLKRVVSSDAAEFLAALQIGTHERGTAIATDDPVVAVAGLRAGNAQAVETAIADPAATAEGLVARLAGVVTATGAPGGADRGLVVRVAGGGAGGTAQTDESAFAEGAGSMTPIGGVLNDTIVSDPTEDQAAAARITPKRALHTNLRSNAGTEIGVTGAPIRTDPTGTTTQPISGSVGLLAGANNIGDVDVLSAPDLHTRNAAFNQASAMGGELDDTTPVAATEGNVSPARITAQRALHANLRNNAGTEIATSAAPLRTDPTGTTTQPVSDGAGSLTVDSGQLPAALSGGRLDVIVGAALPAGLNNIGDVDVLTLPATPIGDNRIGRIKITDDTNVAGVKTADPAATDPGVVVRIAGGLKNVGWDAGAVAVQRGLQIGVTAITEQTLLAADAANLYNVLDIAYSAFSGTTAPGGVRYLSFRHGAAGTEFLRVYLPNLANEKANGEISFAMPDRGALNQAVTVQLNAALGTAGEYSATVHAYKTAS